MRGNMNKCAIALCLITILAATVLCTGCWKGTRPDNPPVRNNPYVGAMVCKRCHEDIYATYLTTGHSQQFQLVEEGRAPEYYWEETMPFPIETPPVGFTWDDVSLVLGGHFGFGVFFDKEGYLITGDQSYWNIQHGRWAAYDPGQATPYDCARCHMSGYDPAGTQDEFPSLAGSWNQDGVTCEGCHGPGRAHVKSRSADDILVDTSEGFCLTCHGESPGHPLPGFGNVDLGNSHQGSWSWCHDPPVSFKYEFERSIWRDCVDCHSPNKGFEKSVKSHRDGICDRFLSLGTR